MEAAVQDLIAFVRIHEAWAAPVVLLLAFGESLAFVSLVLPAWGALVAIGALIGVAGYRFWPIWLAGALGAALGDWLSYWFGFRFKEHVAADLAAVALSRPTSARRGFCSKWGVPSMFIGRFFGSVAGTGSAGRGDLRDAVLEFPVRQCAVGAGLVGGAAAVRRRNSQALIKLTQ